MGCSNSRVQDGPAGADRGPVPRPATTSVAKPTSSSAPNQQGTLPTNRLSLSGARIPPSQLNDSQSSGVRVMSGGISKPIAVSTPGNDASWPITLSLLENNLLTVTIYHHEMQSMVSGPFWCWTYITSGLAALGQKEMVFTLKRRVAAESEQDFQKDIIEWFSNIYTFAKDKLLVDEWAQSRFYRKGFLGREDIRLVLYSPPLDIRALPVGALPAERLHVIPATGPEADVVHYYSVSRFISQLGKSERWFPVHPWFDRDRDHCVTPAQMTGTMRSMFSFTTVGAVSVIKRGSYLVLYVPDKSAQVLKEAIAAQDPSKVLGLDSYPYKGSDCGMTWTNQDKIHMAYGIGSTCMSLGFLVFCPDQDEEACMMQEDGYILLLKRPTWVRIMESIKLFEPMQLRIKDMTFCLEFAAPEAKVMPPKLPSSAREPQLASYPERPAQAHAKQQAQNTTLATLTEHKRTLPSAECVLATKSGEPGFWHAQKYNSTSVPSANKRGPLVLTLGELEADEHKSCDKCIILARGVRSYMPSSDKTLRLQFSHRGSKLCCAVEGDSGLELILEVSPENTLLCPWLTYRMAAQASNRTVTDSNTDQALKWYTDCQSGHQPCKPAPSGPFPSRMLDLGSGNAQSDTMRLIETPPTKGIYGTLSHCWPTGETITTTVATLENHKRGIALSDIPNSFHNSIILFRKLGIRYIWVDSLCIIQDSEDDWKAQASQIDAIFANSNITIAVADDGGCTPGCFLSEPPDLRSRIIRWPGIDGSGAYLTAIQHSSEHTPLLRTGVAAGVGAGSDWVHPERRQSKRILYVARTELIWECKVCSECECGYRTLIA